VVYHLQYTVDSNILNKESVFHLPNQGLHTFLSEGNISFHTTVRGPDFLRNVIVSGYVTFYQIN